MKRGKIKTHKNGKKGALGPWPSIIGGIIVCVIIFYMIGYVAAGGLKQTRILINNEAFMEFTNLISEGWTSGTSTITEWQMVGLEKEIWGILILDRNLSRAIYQTRGCSGAETGLCLTLESKAVLQDCLAHGTDLCICLVSFSTGKSPEAFKKTVVVSPGTSLTESFENIHNWSNTKMRPLPNARIEFNACKYFMRDLLCLNPDGQPCLLKTENGDVLLWIGTNSKDKINFETLKVSRAMQYDATFLNITGTVSASGAENVLDNPANNVPIFELEAYVPTIGPNN